MPADGPLISVITPVYNGADYLPALIESVQAQTYPHVEHIVIDDGSNDDGATIAVLERYPHLRWWTRENRGQYATQNEGLHAAQGEIVVVIAADDVFAGPEVFEQVVARWQAQRGAEVVYGRTAYMNEDGTPFPGFELSVPPSRWLLRYHVYVQHCSVFASRALIERESITFDDSYRYAGDWDWLIRLFDAAETIGYLNRPLAIVRHHTQQTSRQSSNQAAKLAEQRRVSQTYGGNHRLHRVIQNTLNTRAMLMLAIHILLQEGPMVLVHRVRHWIRRRLKYLTSPGE